MLSTGQKAPDFSLPGVEGTDPSFYDLHRFVEDVDATVLAFVPSAHAPVCEDDLRALGAAGWGRREDLLVWTITGDSIFANASAYRDLDLDSPVISDFHAGIADSYGVCLDDWHGHRDIPGRALFVVDPDWTVRHAWQADPFETPDPSPLDAVAASLSDLGVGVDAPSVEYTA
jgi:peroxiredoxin